VTIVFTRASVNRAGSLSGADERPLSIHTPTKVTSFGIDLQAAQLISASVGLVTSPPDVPLDDRETSDISEDPSPAVQMMWLGALLPLPIELRPDGTAPGTGDDSKQKSRIELVNVIEVGLAPAGVPREERSVDPRSVSIDPITVDLPTPAPELRFTPETTSPAIMLPASTMDESLLADSPMDVMRLPLGDQSPSQPTVAEELKSIDAPTPDAENTVTVDRPTGFVSAQLNEVHPNIPHSTTQSSRSPGVLPADPRTELSEVVRQVRTLVTEHETRTTIQLEPAELGRLTLELIDAPQGLSAHISAEDPAVLQFLERNVQLLETEARLQGVGPMSFSVGADVSGGLGRGDSQQSEAETSSRKHIEWNTTSHTKPRSRRELDTNA